MIILLLSLFACKKELTDLGSDLVTDGEKIVFTVDTLSGFEFRMKTGKSILYQQNNLLNSNPALLLGQTSDNIFGSLKSNFITEVIYLYDEAFHSKVDRVDSVVVKIYKDDTQIPKPSSSNSDPVKEMSVKLYTLTDTITKESYSDPKFYYSRVNADKLINSSVFKSESKMKSNGDTIIFANLDKEIGEKIILIDAEILKDAEKFRANFPGFRIASDNDDLSKNFLQRYSDLRTTIFYYEEGKTEVKDRKKFEISSHLYRSGMLLYRDYSAGLFNDLVDKDKSSEEVYLGNLAAPFLEMDISSIQDWAESKSESIAINKAEIRVNVKSRNDINEKEYPRNAWITGFNDENDKIFSVLGSLDGEESKQYYYTFNITDILKKVYDKKYKISKINLSADSMEPNTCTNFFELRKVCLYSKKENLGPQLIISYTKK